MERANQVLVEAGEVNQTEAHPEEAFLNLIASGYHH